MRRITIAAAGCMAFAVAPAWAMGPVDLDVQVGGWRTAISGDVRNGTDNLDVKNDLNMGDQTKIYLRGRLHLPVVGNIYVGYSPLNYTGNSTLTRTVTFGNTPYTLGTPISSEVDLKTYDLGWTFTALDIAITELELGINVKYVDGTVTVKDATQSETADIAAPVPQLKAVVRVHGPMIGAEVDGAGIAYGGNHLYDVSAQLKVSPMPLLYVAGGYRYIDFRLEDGEKRAQVRTAGPFVGLGMNF